MAFLCQQETILVPKRRESTYKINEKREERKIGNSVTKEGGDNNEMISSFKYYKRDYQIYYHSTAISN